ncbi:glutathione S-transferase family protein [Pseudomonas syringae]|uniref:Glutathione S-transferase n=1 Tax=Pseudomonas syringae pv. actinidiae TaxID=103796 RepID=A0A2V0QN66_PSESF|nr:glutathione S-transferase [Pseudomonas syringae]AQL37928.1 glutathione S-transferase [Pseudomonas syringae pv. actinidiae ICMP 9853]EGH66102.1 putative glutathione S-transferase [Pseudomonas syringae pv. actinidiae str. M302091]EPM52638.1 glutathione S-transferase [Pseudomonas syringae pv. actinidiae ICMP 19103]EPM57210.1 glutathione S-transferase [Pseudomonas syringae pv. actinidiae ICMP 19073]EPM87312.1 glutathione S-transferase [Pseudomonas syringae pv. actinidiae ICMP 19068]
MYTLFGSKASGSAAIEVALECCAVKYEVVSACSWEEGPGKDALKRVNPLLQVPTLILPDHTVLSESVAILVYLGLEYPASGLLPKDSTRCAQVLRALIYIAANCYAPIGIIDYPQRWLPGADAALQARLESGAQARLHENWEVFADLFGSPDAWQPDAPGAVEILAATVTRWGRAREHLRACRPQFHAALLQADAHRVMSAVMQRHWG